MIRLAVCALAVCVFAAPALAHPHVWVTARTAVVFDAAGKVTALRHEWTFDELYSAFQAQGVETKDGVATAEGLAPLAKLQIDSLKAFGWFTFPKAGGQTVEFAAPREESLVQTQDKLVTLRFTLPLAAPASAGKAFAFQVYDPSYFVDFKFADGGAVTLEGAPKGCSASVVAPPPLFGEDLKTKDESFFTGLAPGANFGAKLASRAVVACP
jgi:ABC-type uncharacterized transport system substrate-binding protein